MINRKSKTAGYTLLELLVTLTIIGMLMALATPIYIDHINKAQIGDALNTLAKLESAAKIAYEENTANTSITYANTEFANNVVTALDAPPVVNGLYIYPGGEAHVADNQFLVCVYVGNLNFSGYVAPTPGVAGTHTRICKQLTAADPIYTVQCGSLEGDDPDIPAKYLPSTCDCANIWGGTC